MCIVPHPTSTYCLAERSTANCQGVRRPSSERGQHKSKAPYGIYIYIYIYIHTHNIYIYIYNTCIYGFRSSSLRPAPAGAPQTTRPQRSGSPPRRSEAPPDLDAVAHSLAPATSAGLGTVSVSLISTCSLPPLSDVMMRLTYFA